MGELSPVPALIQKQVAEMDPQKRILKNPGYRMETIDGEALLYSQRDTKVVSLNQTACLVWEMCDGQNTPDSIIKILCETYPGASGDIPSDVNEVLDLLLKHNALMQI